MNMKRAAGWGFLLFVGLVLIMSGVTGRFADVLAALVDPQDLESVAVLDQQIMAQFGSILG